MCFADKGLKLFSSCFEEEKVTGLEHDNISERTSFRRDML